jgi:drug/metabolite transporter (DMT)-like permease
MEGYFGEIAALLTSVFWTVTGLSFAMVSSRVTMLVMTLVPPITALIGWLFLKEVMNLKEVAGMFLVVSGIGMAILRRNNSRKQEHLPWIIGSNSAST